MKMYLRVWCWLRRLMLSKLSCYQFTIICMSAPLHQLLIAAAKSTNLGSVNDDAGRSGLDNIHWIYRAVGLMMTVGHIGESNGRDIRLVYLTIIYQDGRVTSDNMMTWGRWVRSNHIGRCLLHATARDMRKCIAEERSILSKEKIMKSIFTRKHILKL